MAIILEHTFISIYGDDVTVKTTRDETCTGFQFWNDGSSRRRVKWTRPSRGGRRETSKSVFFLNCPFVKSRAVCETGTEDDRRRTTRNRQSRATVARAFRRFSRLQSDGRRLTIFPRPKNTRPSGRLAKITATVFRHGKRVLLKYRFRSSARITR